MQSTPFQPKAGRTPLSARPGRSATSWPMWRLATNSSTLGSWMRWERIAPDRTCRSTPIPDWFVDRGLGDSITLMTRLHQRSPRKGESANFHIHRTDGEGEWVLRADRGEAVVESGHAKADVAMRGTAEGLYWVLMGRGKPEEHGVEVHGDPALAAAFKEWFPGP